jgi:adenylate kinase family enzyme
VRLGGITGIPVIELDPIFWKPGLVATPRTKWIQVQQELVQGHWWIMDGDLGPYDAVEIRLRAADTIVFLDMPIVVCMWRALQRSPERLDFWLWLLRYRFRSRPFLLNAISEHAAHASVHVLRTSAEVAQFLANARKFISP